MPIRALLVDDDFATLAAAAARFQSPRSRFQPVALTVAQTWQAARVRIMLEAFDVILLGHRVSDATAVEMLTALQGLPHAPVIVLTPDGDLDLAMRLLRTGASDCVMRHLSDWEVEAHLAVERVTASARRRGTLADRNGGLTEYASILAALLLRRQTRAFAPACAAA